MIITSFYTKNTPYEIVIHKYLIPSLIKFDLKHDIEGIDDLGDWNANAGYKSTLIKEMMLKYKEDICFLDADARILKYPELLFKIPIQYDLAVHFLNWEKFWRGKDGGNKFELLSGTMVMKYCQSNLDLIDKWIYNFEQQKNIWEQKVLEELVVNDPKQRVYNLPASYCAITKPGGTIPSYIGEPVIQHFQVSRKYKR